MAKPAEPQAKLAPPCSDMPAFAAANLGMPPRGPALLKALAVKLPVAPTGQ